MRTSGRRRTRKLGPVRFNFSGHRLTSITGPHPYKFWTWATERAYYYEASKARRS